MLSAKFEEITPQKAEEWLRRNTKNRKLRVSLIARYAEDMRRGWWHPDAGQAIVLDADGNLVDGQHRLKACIQAGVPFTNLVVRGAGNDAKEAIDTGLRRTFADILEWKGEVNTQMLGGVVRTAWRWQNGLILGTSGYGTFSYAEGLDWLDHNPSVRHVLSDAQRIRQKHGVSPAAMGAFLHRTRLVDWEASVDFLNQVEYGEDIHRGDPAYALRSWVNMVRNRTPKPDRDLYLVHIIKAWNAYAKGEEMEQLHFKTGGIRQKREKFPVLLDTNGNPVEFRNEKEDVTSAEGE